MAEQKEIEVIVVDQKEYAIVGRAQAILSEMARELGIPRSYSRFAVYQLATTHHIDIIKTPSANYYSVQGLYGLRSKIKPSKGNKSGRKHYTEEQKKQAMQLYVSGLSCREIAKQTGYSYQSINNWVTRTGLKRTKKNEVR